MLLQVVNARRLLAFCRYDAKPFGSKPPSLFRHAAGEFGFESAARIDDSPIGRDTFLAFSCSFLGGLCNDSQKDAGRHWAGDIRAGVPGQRIAQLAYGDDSALRDAPYKCVDVERPRDQHGPDPSLALRAIGRHDPAVVGVLSM